MTHTEAEELRRINRGMTRLVAAVQELSMARSLEAVMAIVREAARELTGADGATFVLREGDECHYADENAIAPLWKGQRFPMGTCISGWAMIHGKAAVVPDIYRDARIPSEAYRPTFVKSLVMVPIRKEAPIGAIGNYWASRRQPTAQEVELLQALANTTSVALENIQINQELEQRVKDRTAALEAANAELESFASTVAHDLHAPARQVASYAHLFKKHCPTELPAKTQHYLDRILEVSGRMPQLISDLLSFSRLGRGELNRKPTDLNKLLTIVCGDLESETAGRQIQWKIQSLPTVLGDESMLRQVLFNLLSNAIKYTRQTAHPVITVSAQHEKPGEVIICVNDNGAGFSMEYAARLFNVFQRLHPANEFEGNGIGLANVRRIVKRHGGRTWAHGEVGKGATFFLTLPLH